MAAITWLDVVAIACELSAINAAAQTMILEHVNTAFDPDNFDGEDAPRLKMLRAYAAAHYAAPIFIGLTYSGPVRSERLDNMERSYSPTLDSYGGRWAGTQYGQTVAMLISQSAARLPRTY